MAESTRTLRRHLAGRGVVDVSTSSCVSTRVVATGPAVIHHCSRKSIIAMQHEVKGLCLVTGTLRALTQAIYDVKRGSDDSDRQTNKDAAKAIAFAEDRAIFNDYRRVNIQGIREGTSNPILNLPSDVRDYPDAVA